MNTCAKVQCVRFNVHALFLVVRTLIEDLHGGRTRDVALADAQSRPPLVEFGHLPRSLLLYGDRLHSRLSHELVFLLHEYSAFASVYP